MNLLPVFKYLGRAEYSEADPKIHWIEAALEAIKSMTKKSNDIRASTLAFELPFVQCFEISFVECINRR